MPRRVIMAGRGQIVIVTKLPGEERAQVDRFQHTDQSTLPSRWMGDFIEHRCKRGWMVVDDVEASRTEVETVLDLTTGKNFDTGGPVQ